jgi:hypothetical protein
MATPKPNDHHAHDHDNDNNQREHAGGAVAPAPAGGALASLAALGKALGNVDTASIVGRSGLPMLSFKREGDGTWRFGQQQTIVEDGSRWGVNPLSFRYGFICFGDGNKVIGERLVAIRQPKPDATELPDHGFPWVEQWCVNLKCLDGADADVEVTFKPTTVGGLQAVAGLIEAVRDRLSGGQHDDKVAPVVQLRKDSYQHSQYGRVWTPQLEIVDWMALGGPAPAPAPTSPPPAEQPRRRRVA